ncbi:MAG: alanine--tRNA ligase, partial [Candidatus Pacebacteria bacterium]|nr:alanine--tRNA ligase [Candidatus Paceibacterota bacterium]
DSEVFYDFGPELGLHEKSVYKDQPCHVNCDCGRFLEIGNSVFMQYKKTKQGFSQLAQKNIDFGGGLERILAAANQDPDIFKTDAFLPIIKQMEQLTAKKYNDHSLADEARSEQTRSFRVIADHLRGAVILASDGVYPSNKEQGYFARRLIRRAVRYGQNLGMNKPFIKQLVKPVVDIFAQAYPDVEAQKNKIEQALDQEELKFLKTLDRGLKEFDKLLTAKQELTAKQAFYLYETYGFPLELSIEEASKNKIKLEADIDNKFAQHKQQHAAESRAGSEAKFKGGLADQSEVATRYHSATHLLHAALRQVLGDHVSQKGSNITGKRLRFDFTHDAALTEQEKQAIEQQINDWIKAKLPVTKQVMAKQKALDSGALAFFVERYPDEVNVYTIGHDAQGKQGDEQKGWISKELCGGPHVSNTAEIGLIEIFKEKSASAGVRRIYARVKN